MEKILKVLRKKNNKNKNVLFKKDFNLLTNTNWLYSGEYRRFINNNSKKVFIHNLL